MGVGIQEIRRVGRELENVNSLKQPFLAHSLLTQYVCMSDYKNEN